MPTYRVSTWKTLYQKAYIDAPTPDHARRIAQQSLDDERDDVQWSTFDSDGGRVEDVELLA